MEEYLKLINQPPTATIRVKKISRFENFKNKLKSKLKDLTFKDLYLGLSVILNIELLIIVARLLILL